MTSLAQLRTSITTTQRKILDRVVDHLIDDGKPIPVRALQGGMRRTTVTEAVKQLGGSVVFEIHQEGYNCYQITQLGILLSTRGDEAETLLQKYIRFLRREFKKNNRLEKLSSEEIQLALKLDADEMPLLFLTLTSSSHGRLGSRYGGKTSDGTWYMSVNDDVTELTDRDPQVLREWIEQEILVRYDKDAPVTELERSTKLLSAQQSFFSTATTAPLSANYPGLQNASLEFVREDTLRSYLLADLQELSKVYGVGAWKSCVILCGGVLEGLLLSHLLLRERDAGEAARILRLKGGNLIDWRLADMVSVAEKLGSLSKGTMHLGHALREFRNLVHPGKQLGDQVLISEGEANVAMETVQIVIRAFEKGG